jgi:acyl dehydratase
MCNSFTDSAASPSPIRPCVFEGVQTLRGLVKQEVAVTGYVEVSQEMITQFADLTCDWQWIHVDAERARKDSPYGGTVAHGFLTLSLIPQFVLNAVQVKGVKLGINFGLNHVRFPSAILAGSQIRARIILASVQEGPNWAQCTWFVSIEQRGAKLPACVAEWLVRYYLD